MLIEAERPPKTFLDVILENAVYLKGDTVFFYSINKFNNPHCSLEDFILLRDGVSVLTKWSPFFCFRKRCRSPPLVLRFLKFGNEGGQAYGKGIQNPGL